MRPAAVRDFSSHSAVRKAEIQTSGLCKVKLSLLHSISVTYPELWLQEKEALSGWGRSPVPELENSWSRGPVCDLEWG